MVKQSGDKTLDQVLLDIEKQFGKGSVMKLGENEHREIDTISSGSLSLDIALGIGGYPKGRIIEIFGPESSGKTTFALHAIAEAQKLGGRVAFIDAEHALDPTYAAKIGVNINELLLSQPDNGEQALEICEALVRSGAISVIVIDSVAALVPQAEIEGEMGDSHVGLQARLMSQALRKLSGAINKTNTIAIFINQLREKVGVMFGNPETTPGGRALKFYSSIRLDIRRSEQIKDGTNIIGNKTSIKVVKNKMAPPFKSCKVDLIFGEGFSKIGEVLDLAIENDFGENAKINYTIVDFGGKHSITNYYSNLQGDNCDNQLNTIYLGKENQVFDLNYIGELRGKKSNIDIEVQGALKDISKKHFKGTIDFKKGCKKATGNENEACMLLSDTAKSIALPMLLCSEEEVEGNHSSSAGKIGEKELFYIMSRGFELKEAMKLMVRARFNQILEKIENEELREEILQEIDKRLD